MIRSKKAQISQEIGLVSRILGSRITVALLYALYAVFISLGASYVAGEVAKWLVTTLLRGGT